MVVTNSESVTRVYQSRQDDAFRQQLILDHIEYAHQVMHSLLLHIPPGVDQENLISAGMLGLTEAANNFDSSKGVNFKSFAFLRIRGAVVDEIRRNSPLPQKLLGQISEMRSVIERLDPPVTPEMISRELGCSVEKVEECLAATRVCSPKSWDEVGGFASYAIARDDENPANHAEKQELVKVLADCLEELPERDRAVIIMYHLEQMLLKEIGEVLGLSESRTSRVLARAEFTLRQMIESQSSK